MPRLSSRNVRVSAKVYIPFRDRSYRISRWDFNVGISGYENVQVSSLVLLSVFQCRKGTRFVSEFNWKKKKKASEKSSFRSKF